MVVKFGGCGINLEKTNIFIKRYLLHEGEDYKAKEIDEMKIRSLMSMNKGRESMRKSLGMNLDTSVEEAIKNFWVMGEFLDQGKSKKRTKLLFPLLLKARRFALISKGVSTSLV